MEPRTLQLMKLQTQQQMELQAQQQVEDGGNDQAAGSSTNTPIRPTNNRWTPTPAQLRILQELYYDRALKNPTPEQIQGICLHLKPSIDLNFDSTGSTGDDGLIDLTLRSCVGYGVDPYSSSPFNANTNTTYFCTTGGPSFMERRGGDHQEVETLPLFPEHGEDILGNPKTTSEEGSTFGYYSGGSGSYNSGSPVSLELSLNPFGAADLA
ncbi:uncharacterized protein LOC112185205 [Rosa chinensis]|uniref:uncharacterized protein LOC112185205 n=1 Tax=Rosa chinensis TaxID=74649 RepID=UPI000D094CAA|nr:uncharacterized protein LOC112185205 [Rosa chinensis]